MNIRRKVLDWFRHSCGVIVIRTVLMYYAIEIGSSLFLSGSFGGVSEMFSIFRIFRIILDVDLFSLFIVRNRLIEFS
jgi:hypothetical protein